MRLCCVFDKQHPASKGGWFSNALLKYQNCLLLGVREGTEDLPRKQNYCGSPLRIFPGTTAVKTSDSAPQLHPSLGTHSTWREDRGVVTCSSEGTGQQNAGSHVQTVFWSRHVGMCGHPPVNPGTGSRIPTIAKMCRCSTSLYKMAQATEILP